MRIYLLGVAHKVQYDKKASLTKEFVEYLKQSIKRLGIVFVAEEFSEDALAKRGVESSTIKDIAVELGIRHKYCDPNEKERKQLGIRSNNETKEELELPKFLNMEDFKKLCEEKAKDHPKKEQYWFEQIENEISEPTIFVCGSVHLEGFKELLIKNGHEAAVLQKTFDSA